MKYLIAEDLGDGEWIDVAKAADKKDAIRIGRAFSNNGTDLVILDTETGEPVWEWYNNRQAEKTY